LPSHSQLCRSIRHRVWLSCPWVFWRKLACCLCCGSCLWVSFVSDYCWKGWVFIINSSNFLVFSELPQWFSHAANVLQRFLGLEEFQFPIGLLLWLIWFGVDDDWMRLVPSCWALIMHFPWTTYKPLLNFHTLAEAS
jgi:hypothetical protein